MAEFQIAFETTLRNEDHDLSGVITYDSGGTTRLGVAQKSHPEVFPEMEECSLERAFQIAEGIYRQYWAFDGVESQLVANQLFDVAVNAGLKKAIEIAQEATGQTVDGIWGPLTERAVNNQSVDMMRNAIKTCIEAFHRELAEKNPAKYNEYLQGWITRDEREANA